MSGPGLTGSELIGIAAFAANYAVIAPASAVCLAIAFARRKRGVPLWLIPVALVNVGVALAQLLLVGPVETWLTALLVAQITLGVVVIAWVVRARSPRR